MDCSALNKQYSIATYQAPCWPESKIMNYYLLTCGENHLEFSLSSIK